MEKLQFIQFLAIDDKGMKQNFQSAKKLMLKYFIISVNIWLLKPIFGSKKIQYSQFLFTQCTNTLEQMAMKSKVSVHKLI